MVREDINREAISCVFPKGRYPMQFDLNQSDQFNELLSTLPYPLDKNELVMHAQQFGTNPQILTAMKQALPDQTFNCANDIKQIIQHNSQLRH